MCFMSLAFHMNFEMPHGHRIDDKGYCSFLPREYSSFPCALVTVPVPPLFLTLFSYTSHFIPFFSNVGQACVSVP